MNITESNFNTSTIPNAVKYTFLKGYNPIKFDKLPILYKLMFYSFQLQINVIPSTLLIILLFILCNKMKCIKLYFLVYNKSELTSTKFMDKLISNYSTFFNVIMILFIIICIIYSYEFVNGIPLIRVIDPFDFIYWYILIILVFVLDM